MAGGTYQSKLREEARIKLMGAMMNAFYDESLTDEMREAMHKQVNRIEKMLGYEINSWQS